MKTEKFNEMFFHVGHNVELKGYENPKNLNLVSVRLECETCNLILLEIFKGE